MFNKTIINTNDTEYIPYEKEVTVHEHKAPTDESIRLLNDFQEKALENTMLVFDVKGDNFNFVARYVELAQGGFNFATIKFSLNNKDIVESFPIDIFRTTDAGKSYTDCIVQQIIEKFKEIILRTITEDMLHSNIMYKINKYN